MLKFRVSWGQLGNTNSDYSSFSDWYPFYQQQSVSASSGSWLIDGARQNTSSMPSIVSSELTWETIGTWDWGLDWSAFNYRLTSTFEYFIRTTKDMIGPAPTLGSALGTSAQKSTTVICAAKVGNLKSDGATALVRLNMVYVSIFQTLNQKF